METNQHKGSKKQKKVDAQSPDTTIAPPTHGEKDASSVSQDLPNPHEVYSKEDEGGQDFNRINQIGNRNGEIHKMNHTLIDTNQKHQQSTEYGIEEEYYDIVNSEEEGQPRDMRRLI